MCQFRRLFTMNMPLGNADILYWGWLMADHEAWTPKFLPERRASFTHAHLLGRLENKHEAMFSIKYDMTSARSRFATNLRFDFEHRISFALCRGTWGSFLRIRFCRVVGNSHFFFVRTFLAILRVCLAQSQHTGTIDMPNNGAKPDAGSCHAILACQCQVPPSAPALSAELFVGKHWQLASVLRLAAKRIKREYWEKILFLTWSIDKCQLILQVFPFSFDGFFLSISAKVKCTKTIKNRIYRDSYATCWVSPSYGIGQHEATKMFSWSMRFDGAGNSTSPTHD